MPNDLIAHMDRLHTTAMGAERIRRNLGLDTADVVAWCRQRIAEPACVLRRQVKNWYACVDGCEITVHAGSYTIITAHRAAKSCSAHGRESREDA